MKKAPFAILFFVFFATISFTADAQTKRKKLENPFENNGDINSQFEYVFKTSTNYKEYKVNSKNGYAQLHKNALDSIALQKELLTEQRNENRNQLSEINALKTELKELSLELNIASTNKNSITLFGTSIYKTNYNLIVIILLLSLLSLAAFFFYKFTNSNAITKDATKRLDEAQEELESVQKRALKRQQELNRKLQDQILKNNKN